MKWIVTIHQKIFLYHTLVTRKDIYYEGICKFINQELDMRTEDGKIIERCLDGEPEVFGLLVDKYKAKCSRR